MQSDVLTLYKLIILFLLNKVTFPLTNAQITNLLLEKEYTTFFTIQQVISQLIEAQLIHTDTIRNSTYFEINDAGRETLSFFNDKIPETIKSELSDYLKLHKFELRDESSTIADYFEEKRGQYMVRCQVKEQGLSIIDLNLVVPLEEEAISICNNWKEKSADVYSYILRTLMNT